MRVLAGFLALLLVLSTYGCGDGPPPNGILLPCSFGGGGPSGYLVAPATPYVMNLVAISAQLGGVSMPAGGVFQAAVPNAAFYPDHDLIAYNPYFMESLFQQYGLAEVPDSIIFHEVGHMWTFKTHHYNRIQSTDNPNVPNKRWRMELIADSFSGAVLRALNGNPIGSLVNYETAFANWSASHPPGTMRAQVFWDAWSTGDVQPLSMSVSLGCDCSSVSFDAAEPSDVVGDLGYDLDAAERSALLDELRLIQRVGHEMLAAGMNPYHSDYAAEFDGRLAAIRAAAGSDERR